jgi:glyoxylase-like metal-dependent hydrolase (beta-lactamase superfamily II)
MIDCGADWLNHQKRVDPTAIVTTHAHADRAAGLAIGTACPVHATQETWALLHHYLVPYRKHVCNREPFFIETVSFEAFPVEHSLRAPAVGYRVTSGRVAFFYAIHQPLQRCEVRDTAQRLMARQALRGRAGDDAS